MPTELDEGLRDFLCANGWQDHHDFVATSIRLRRVNKVVFLVPVPEGYQLVSTMLIESSDSGERIEVLEQHFPTMVDLLTNLLETNHFSLEAFGGKVWVKQRVSVSEIRDIENLNRSAVGLALFADHWGDHPFADDNDWMRWLMSEGR